MNLVGKIFIFLVFVMSVVFSAFSVMVFATHKNWKEEVLRTESTPDGKPVGWKKRLENAERLQIEADGKMRDLEDEIEAVRVAKRQQVAKLEQEKERLMASVGSLTNQYNEKSELLTKALTDVDAAQTKLEILRTEGNEMRQEIREAREVITTKFATLLKVREELNQNLGQVALLNVRNKELNNAVAQAEAWLKKFGVNKETPLDSIEPLVPGLVTRVKKIKDDIFVEITIGSDDGLRKGHQMEVYRGSTYVGRLDIIKAYPDRSVGRVDRRYQQMLIQARDQVKARRSMKLTAG
ncbi:MAG: hypothetical protein OES79_15615 [Planctomycetota bacterium]|nr:hypothetical protein [Planctomycetota bacterium]